MDNFERAQAVIREYEGGYVNNPNDPGGATNFGITHRTLAAWRKVPSVSAEDVRNLTYEEAKQIYRANYWEVNRCSDLPGPMALAVYNIGVHAGPKTGATYLQRALNSQGASIEVDGDVGALTITATQRVNLQTALKDIIDLYESRLRGHPKFYYYQKGFLNRVRLLRNETSKWAAEISQPATMASGSNTTPQSPQESIMTGTTNQGNLASLLQQIQALLVALNTGASPTPVQQPAASSPASGADPQKQLLAILQILLNPPKDGAETASSALGTVNGALGPAIGNLLNGKKSFLGIAGAVLTAILGNAESASAIGKLATSIPVLGGTSGIFLPIFIGLAAWGALGKMEKWAGGQITTPPKS